MDKDLKLYEILEQCITESNSLVRELTHNDHWVELMRAISGIGEFFSVLIAYEVDDIRRFATEKKFFSYIGLIPSTFSSGGRTFYGRLIK